MDTTLPRSRFKDVWLPLFIIVASFFFFSWQNGVDVWQKMALLVALFLMVSEKQHQLYQRKKGKMLTVHSGLTAFYISGLMLSIAMLLIYWQGAEGFLQEHALTIVVAFFVVGALNLIFPTAKADQPAGSASKSPNRLFLLWAPLWLALAAYGVVTKPELSLGQLGFFLIGLGYLVLPYPLDDGWPKLARRTSYGILLAVLLAETLWP